MSDCRPDDQTPATTDDCAACGVAPDRRAFLRTSAVAVAAALLGLGAREADALAPLAFTRARAARGQTRAYAIPAKDGAEIDKDNEVIVVRWQNAVYAFALSCPHQNTALRWNEKDKEFQCPKHHSTFKPDGGYIEGRSQRAMDRLAIGQDPAGGVVVNVEKLIQIDKDPSGWAAAMVKVA